MINKFFQKGIVSFCLLLSVSCGTILDEGKISGRWEITGADFYVYNATNDSYICYSGTNAEEVSLQKPLIGNFFFSSSNKIVMQFNTNGEFQVTATASDNSSIPIVSIPNGTWKLDTYNNAVTLNVKEDTEKKTYGIWSDGFTVTISWPLSTPSKMELLLKNTDVGVDFFSIAEAGLQATMMKGYFEKNDS